MKKYYLILALILAIVMLSAETCGTQEDCVPSCGDGIICLNAGEQCEPGINTNGGYCTPDTCQLRCTSPRYKANPDVIVCTCNAIWEDRNNGVCNEFTGTQDILRVDISGCGYPSTETQVACQCNPNIVYSTTYGECIVIFNPFAGDRMVRRYDNCYRLISETSEPCDPTPPPPPPAPGSNCPAIEVLPEDCSIGSNVYKICNTLQSGTGYLSYHCLSGICQAESQC